jgi:cobalamin biosynthesis protein CobD/CbiB
MVKEIKKATQETLSTLEALWGVLLIVAQTAASVIIAVYACTFNEFGYLVIATVAVACVLAANVLLTLFRLIRKSY